MQLSLTVNGKAVSVEVEARTHPSGADDKFFNITVVWRKTIERRAKG